ncbi:hypothetical protein [Azospirillum sp.]|uniref:hypothetical protein n=1 Tax=Azospirillum sp. TaxID=34012 RepID=UPI002D5F3C7F|nr:hypothetical protein [Azospirillum sp.]HYD64193.1 hypothetical protein [Azospirillum sp.]
MGEPARKIDTLNLDAAMAYKAAAEAVFAVDCGVTAEDVLGDTSYIVTVPVPPTVARPHRAYADLEERVQREIETRFPEFLGRAYLRYVRNGDAA